MPDPYFRSLSVDPSRALDYWTRAPRAQYERHADALLSAGRFADVALLDNRRRQYAQRVAEFASEFFSGRGHGGKGAMSA
jgi:hypothetical protein